MHTEEYINAQPCNNTYKYVIVAFTCIKNELHNSFAIRSHNSFLLLGLRLLRFFFNMVYRFSKEFKSGD